MFDWLGGKEGIQHLFSHFKRNAGAVIANSDCVVQLGVFLASISFIVAHCLVVLATGLYRLVGRVSK